MSFLFSPYSLTQIHNYWCLFWIYSAVIISEAESETFRMAVKPIICQVLYDVSVPGADWTSNPPEGPAPGVGRFLLIGLSCQVDRSFTCHGGGTP